MHYLINNAGMIRDVTWNTFGWQTLRRMDSEDGHELVMATNYLGPFLLTHLLLDKVISSGAPGGGDSRIIHVSSDAHLTKFDFQGFDLNARSGVKYLEWTQYSNSKLMQVMFSKHLAGRMEGTSAQSVSVHPGWVRTEIGSGHLLQYPFYLWLLMTGKSPRQGAQTTLHCCLTDEKVNGKFYSNCSVESERLTTPYVKDESLVEVSHAKTKKLLGI